MFATALSAVAEFVVRTLPAAARHQFDGSTEEVDGEETVSDTATGKRRNLPRNPSCAPFALSSERRRISMARRTQRSSA